MLRLISTILLISFFITTSVAPVAAAINYTYDANGNMTSDGTRCFEYNDANQLKKVKNCGNNQIIAEYLYDYTGKRIVKKEYENGTLKHTIYSPTDEFETKKLPNGTTENTTYFKVNDEVVAKKNPDGSMHYIHNDHLGSTSVITNQSGQVVEKTTYEPYGEVKAGGTKSKFGYTGQEKDQETGLNYYEARYYDPHIHRFTQPDEIIQDVYDPQTLNRYSYVKNNPIKYTDPTGNIAFVPLLLIGAGIGGFSKMAAVKLAYPETDGWEMGDAFIEGAAAGGLTTAATVVATPWAASGLGAVGISGAAKSIGADMLIGGFLSGSQQLGSNLLDEKTRNDPFRNVYQTMSAGALTAGAGSYVGRGIVPTTRGAESSKLSIGFTGPKSVEHTLQNGVGQFFEKLTLPAVAAVYRGSSKAQVSKAQPSNSNTTPKKQSNSVFSKHVPLWNLLK